MHKPLATPPACTGTSVPNPKALQNCRPSLCPQPAQALPWSLQSCPCLPILTPTDLLHVTSSGSLSKSHVAAKLGSISKWNTFLNRITQIPIDLPGQYCSPKLWSGQPSPGTHPLKIFSRCPLPTGLGVCSGLGWQELKLITLVSQDSKWHPQGLVE